MIQKRTYHVYHMHYVMDGYFPMYPFNSPENGNYRRNLVNRISLADSFFGSVQPHCPVSLQEVFEL